MTKLTDAERVQFAACFGDRGGNLFMVYQAAERILADRFAATGRACDCSDNPLEANPHRALLTPTDTPPDNTALTDELRTLTDPHDVRLTEAERKYLAEWVLGGSTPSPLMVRAVERILANRLDAESDR